MEQPEITPHQPKPHLHKEYEDPHFHDDDLELSEEAGRQTPRSGSPPKPARRLPPPPRRFED